MFRKNGLQSVLGRKENSLKKWWILLLVLVCTLFTGCKKNTQEEDIVVEEIDIPGVIVDVLTCAYEYSYSEQQDGTLLFAINGEWDSKQTWKVTYEQDVIADVREVSQSNKEAKFEFSPKEGMGGYSEYYIELYDTATKEKQYTFGVPIMVSQEDKTITVLDIFFYAPSEETAEVDVEEDVEADVEDVKEDIDKDTEETDLEDEEASQDTVADFEEIVGNVQVAKEVEILDVAVTEYTDRKDGKKAGEMLFTYEGKEFSCTIAPNTPLSYYKKQVETDNYTMETKDIDGVEVTVYTVDHNRMILWKTSDNVRYVLKEKNFKDDSALKAVEMLIKYN